jgi:hypothetical protein
MKLNKKFTNRARQQTRCRGFVKSESAAKQIKMQEFFSSRADSSCAEVCPRESLLVRFLQSTQPDRRIRQQVVNSLLTFGAALIFFRANDL